MMQKPNRSMAGLPNSVLIGLSCCALHFTDTSHALPQSKMPKFGTHATQQRRAVVVRNKRMGHRRRLVGLELKNGEIWFANLPSGDRPVLILTRDPVAEIIGSIVVAAISRTRRGLVS